MNIILIFCRIFVIINLIKFTKYGKMYMGGGKVMNNDIKLRSVQVVMFFKNEVQYNSLELANGIFKKLPQLGQPNIFNLPKEVPNEIRLQTPRIIFNNANGFNLTISVLNITLNIIGENSVQEIKNYMNIIFGELAMHDIKIGAIGCVFDYINFDTDFEKIQNKYYKDELVTSSLVNSSWYNKENSLNIWKFLNVTEENSKKILNIKVDINNRGNVDAMTTESISQLIEKAFTKAEEFKEKIKSELGD